MNPALFPPEQDIVVKNWGKHFTRSVHVTLDGNSMIAILSVRKPDENWCEPRFCVLKGDLTHREMGEMRDLVDLAEQVGRIIHMEETTEEDITDIL